MVCGECPLIVASFNCIPYGLICALTVPSDFDAKIISTSNDHRDAEECLVRRVHVLGKRLSLPYGFQSFLSVASPPAGIFTISVARRWRIQ